MSRFEPVAQCAGCRAMYGMGFNFHDPQFGDPTHPLYRISSTWWWPYKHRPPR
jgi:hypothetical protein